MLDYLFLPEDLIPDEIKKKIVTIINGIEHNIIPESYPNEMIKILSSICYERREYIRSIMGFSLLANSWIKPLAKWIKKRKCLEIMAGTGALSKALSDNDVSIIATDNLSWHDTRFDKNNLWYPVIEMDAIRAIEIYGNYVDIVIVSWAFMDSVLYNCLLRMREINKKLIILYLGETIYGCCANYEFFNEANQIVDKKLLKATHQYQTWCTVNDTITLYR